MKIGEPRNFVDSDVQYLSKAATGEIWNDRLRAGTLQMARLPKVKIMGLAEEI